MVDNLDSYRSKLYNYNSDDEVYWKVITSNTDTKCLNVTIYNTLYYRSNIRVEIFNYWTGYFLIFITIYFKF